MAGGESANGMKNLQKIDAECPKCEGQRKCFVHAKVEKTGSFDTGACTENFWHDRYLLECCGCEEVFFYSKYKDTMEYYYVGVEPDVEMILIEKIDSYPKSEPESDSPGWFGEIYKADGVLYDIMSQVYIAKRNNLFVLAAIGLRTVIDRASELLKIDASLTMEAKLKGLLSGGWIGDTEFRTLEVVVEAGNAAAHRGWTPNAKQFQLLLLASETFLHRTFVLGENALGIAKGIPERPKKKKVQK